MSVYFLSSSLTSKAIEQGLVFIDWFAQQSLSIWDFMSILFCDLIYDLTESTS